jgi:hypothetical protein
MFIRKISLPRRTFLRGVGVTMALPFLESMVPALTAASKAVHPRLKFGAVYIPHGAIMNQWTPKGTGTDFEFSPILQPLAPFREQLTVVSGMNGPVGGHGVAAAVYLSGVAPKRTPGVDVLNNTTIDQIIANRIGQDTPLPSLELATEDFSGFIGACDTDYSCQYMNTLAWKTPTTPLPMEINPRVVFERLFGGTGTPDERRDQMTTDRSILDSVASEAAQLQRKVGPRDRARLGDYLDHIREIERRIQRSEQQANTHVATPNAPIGVPDSFEEHVALMFELLTVAFQADITRVFTFLMARELSHCTYPQIGINDPHHALSHHLQDPAKIAKLVTLNAYHYGLFAKFVDRLRTIPDGDGSVLDHSIILYGSGMSDANSHSNIALPYVVLAGKASNIKGGRHLAQPAGTPNANLLVDLAQKAGVDIEKFGASTGGVNL